MRNRRGQYGLIVGLVVSCGATLASGKEGVRLRFSTGQGSEEKPVTVTVTGKVTDAKTGKPIAEAVVGGHILVWRHMGPEVYAKAPHKVTRSDKNGAYKLTFVTPLTTAGPMKDKDSLCVTASASGYETRPQYVRPYVTSAKTDYTGVDFALHRGKLVKGKVVDENGKPIEGALLRVQGSGNGNWTYFGSLGRALTNERGEFEIWCSTDRQGIMCKNPWVRVSKRGYGTGFFWDPMGKDSMGSLTILKGGTIVGKVVDTKGKGLAKCQISVCDTWKNVFDQTTTDENGRYELKGIPGGGTYKPFYTRRSGRYDKRWGKVTVSARTRPEMNLRDVPQYQIAAEEGKSVVGPELVVGGEAGVSGKLIPSKTTFGLKDLMVRLDHDWGRMVEVDAEGRFSFKFVTPGKHRLTAYLPNNLRGDRGIGHTEIHVKSGEPLEGIQIELETLAEVRALYVDADGNPLSGITAGATWDRSGHGFWTEGTVSGEDGRAVVYLYPDQLQYVRGFDRGDRSLVAENYEAVKPKAGSVVNKVRIVMVPTAKIRGRLVDEAGAPLVEKLAICQLEFADSVKQPKRLKTDSAGRFEFAKLVPGVVSLEIETHPLEYSGGTAKPIEIKPGEDKDLGDLVLKRIAFRKVSGRVIPSKTVTDVKGLKIRVGLQRWEPMVLTDAEGRFVLPKVQPGKQRLTAYLPFNLRTDRGVGHVLVEVKDRDVENVKLPLESLAKIHLRIEDEAGKPLEGIAAAAWWSENHSGVFTEGSKSDKEGKATLYLYPGTLQYVGAHDWDSVYRLKDHIRVRLMPGEVRKDVRVVMTQSPAPSSE